MALICTYRGSDCEMVLTLSRFNSSYNNIVFTRRKRKKSFAGEYGSKWVQLWTWEKGWKVDKLFTDFGVMVALNCLRMVSLEGS